MSEDVIQESKESVFRPPLAYIKDASTKPWKIVVSASLALISALTLFSNVTMDGTTAYHALRAVFPMHPGIGASAFLLFFAYLFAFLNLKSLMLSIPVCPYASR